MNWSVEPIPLRDDQGTLRIGDSRITLDTLVGAYAMGSTAERLTKDFPSITLAEVYSVLGYYLRHQEQIETEYLAPRRQQALGGQSQTGGPDDLRFDPGCPRW
jgi:uncharacterized protein (DUF433 family)